jgi:hypothetical protein
MSIARLGPGQSWSSLATSGLALQLDRSLPASPRRLLLLIPILPRPLSPSLRSGARTNDSRFPSLYLKVLALSQNLLPTITPLLNQIDPILSRDSQVRIGSVGVCIGGGHDILGDEDGGVGVGRGD